MINDFILFSLSTIMLTSTEQCSLIPTETMPQILDARVENISTPAATKVAVAMSGGVDSSTTALLLKQAGYDVVGVTGWLVKSGSRCCDTGMIDAFRVCEQLGIEHHSVDLRELFKHEIIDQFPISYAKGQTPLPCSLCNTIIKWGALLNYSRKHLQAQYMATGHYARVIQTQEGPRLARAKDQTKDQSYVLWGCTLDQLASTMLPLGDYTKEEIRSIASEHGLVTAARPDSQDLCFIPEGQSTQSYLAQFLPENPGPFINILTGEALGEHKGTHNFTVGQRKGIGISSPEPLYVVKIEPATRTVFVGPKQALYCDELGAHCVNWICDTPPVKPFKARAKIRYNSPTVPAMIYPFADSQVRVVFDEPQSAVTSGQVLGMYDSSDVYLLGGGWID
jgi:tRNA-specific 2-thiouridylase